MLKKIFYKIDNINLETLFQYRNVWMGLAIILVIFYHTGIGVGNLFVDCIMALCVIAVDIFIFASGIGCYYSLSKNSNIIDFLKRRFMKLMPTYWTFIIIWIIYKLITSNISITAIIGNILCIQIFTNLGNYFNWYISAIWLLYFLSPFFKGIIENIKSFKCCFLIISILIIFSVPFWNSELLVIASRIPSFFLGMYFGKLGKDGKILNKKNVIFMMSSMFIGIILLFGSYVVFTSEEMWNYGLSWYPFILITTGFCFSFSYILELIKNTKIQKIVIYILAFLGKYSFELYLLHILLFDIYTSQFVANGIGNKSIMEWLVVIVLLIPCCIILKFLEKYMVKFAFFIKNINKHFFNIKMIKNDN